MPQKINMIISNGLPPRSLQQLNIASLGFAPGFATPIEPSSIPIPKAPSALNAPFIARVHNVKPGCGSCGKH